MTGLSQVAIGKRPTASSFGSEGEPGTKRMHPGVFRSETIQGVTQLAERLRATPEDDRAALSDALEQLQDYVVDEKVLELSKIGFLTSLLIKNSDQKISARARALVNTWKKDREIRNAVVKGFMRVNFNLRDARLLEDGVFNASCQLGYLEGSSKKEYQRHFIRLLTHMKDRGPGSVVERLRCGGLRLEELAFRSDEELASDARRKRLAAHRRAGLMEAMAYTGANVDGTPSDNYVCPKCGGSKCLYREVTSGWHNDQQGPSALMQCTECGERWKDSEASS